MNDSCFRKVQTLRLLPKSPNRKSVSQLLEELTIQGFVLDRRSLQRDLKSLANLFPIENDGNKDIPGWYWRKDAQKLEMPEMEPTVALTFQMVKAHLQKFMPPSVLSELSPYFSNADKLLGNLKQNGLSSWSDKVATINRSQPLIAPKIDDKILSSIYLALLSETQIKAHYQPKLEEPRDYTINPLGVVIVDQVIYLVGTLWEYQDLRQFALHRFLKAENTQTANIEVNNFSLKDYITDGKFYFPIEESNKQIVLKIRTNKSIANHLEEVKLSEDQSIKKLDDNEFYEVTASVDNTQQLRWWLNGFGAGLEVIEPTALREEFREMARLINGFYF